MDTCFGGILTKSKDVFLLQICLSIYFYSVYNTAHDVLTIPGLFSGLSHHKVSWGQPFATLWTPAGTPDNQNDTLKWKRLAGGLFYYTV